MGGRLLKDQSSFNSGIHGILFFDFHPYFNSIVFALRLFIFVRFFYHLIDKHVYSVIVIINCANTVPMR